MRHYQEGRFDVPVGGTELTNQIGEIARALENFGRMGGQQALTLSALDGAQTNVMVTDAGDTITFVNKAMASFLTGAREEFLSAGCRLDGKPLVGQSIEVLQPSGSGKAAIVTTVDSPARQRIEMGGLTIDLIVTPVRRADATRIGTIFEWIDRTGELHAQAEVAGVAQAVAEGDFSKRDPAGGQEGLHERHRRRASTPSPPPSTRPPPSSPTP